MGVQTSKQEVKTKNAAHKLLSQEEQEYVGHISTDELAELMENSPETLRILNCTVKTGPHISDPFVEHAKTHIKGAQFFDMILCTDTNSQIPYMMPGQGYFIQLMKSQDIRKTHTVVVYETGKGFFAERAAFMFTIFGHPNVKVLDG